jgi:hypothetical protein
MTRTSPAWLLALTALTLAGCSGGPGAGGSPSSPPAASSTADGRPPYAGAPKIANPLPVSVLSGDPCATALSPDQTKTIFGQVEQGARSDHGALGPTCEWSNLDTGALVLVTYDSTHDGLSSAYRGTKPRAIVWRETSVQGFPAAAHVTDLGGSKDEFCDLSVGIADNASVDIGLTLSRTKVGKTDPCDVDLQIADMVIGNLKHKAGS